MNVYQKVGTLIVRLVGLVMAAVALVGFAYLATVEVRGVGNSIPAPRIVASAEWLVIALILLAASKPLGKLLGSGLG